MKLLNKFGTQEYFYVVDHKNTLTTNNLRNPILDIYS